MALLLVASLLFLLPPATVAINWGDMIEDIAKAKQSQEQRDSSWYACIQMVTTIGCDERITPRPSPVAPVVTSDQGALSWTPRKEDEINKVMHVDIDGWSRRLGLEKVVEKFGPIVIGGRGGSDTHENYRVLAGFGFDPVVERVSATKQAFRAAKSVLTPQKTPQKHEGPKHAIMFDPQSPETLMKIPLEELQGWMSKTEDATSITAATLDGKASSAFIVHIFATKDDEKEHREKERWCAAAARYTAEQDETHDDPDDESEKPRRGNPLSELVGRVFQKEDEVQWEGGRHEESGRDERRLRKLSDKEIKDTSDAILKWRGEIRALEKAIDEKKHRAGVKKAPFYKIHDVHWLVVEEGVSRAYANFATGEKLGFEGFAAFYYLADLETNPNKVNSWAPASRIQALRAGGLKEDIALRRAHPATTAFNLFLA